MLLEISLPVLAREHDSALHHRVELVREAFGSLLPPAPCAP